MAKCCWLIWFLVLLSLVSVYEASPGDADSLYRACLLKCEKTGCVGARCFSCCYSASNDYSLDDCWYKLKHPYLWWKHWDRQNNCRYHCMLYREKERAELGLEPVKYHGKWPVQRQYGFQEPFSVAFSALNLVMHFHGWRSFSNLLYYSLPLKPDKTPFYDYSGLCNFYGLLSINTWFWSAVFHFRDVDVTEKLDYSSYVILLGYSIILAIIRSFCLRHDAARVMHLQLPTFCFFATIRCTMVSSNFFNYLHLIFIFLALVFSAFKGMITFVMKWNMKVCTALEIDQLVTWSIWAGRTHHPSRWKMWIVVVGGGLAMALKILDFPPYQGLVDVHALCHASSIPLTYMWWKFIKDDAEFRTADLLKKKKKTDCNSSNSSAAIATAT